jgi:hypothetical protein
MSEQELIKVLIVNEHGQYIAGSAHHWEFTEDRSRARVFDYEQDRVAEQIKLVRKAHGIVWIAVRLDPREIYEFCDRCGSRMITRNIFFDGQQYFCHDCACETNSRQAC